MSEKPKRMLQGDKPSGFYRRLFLLLNIPPLILAAVLMLPALMIDHIQQHLNVECSVVLGMDHMLIIRPDAEHNHILHYYVVGVDGDESALVWSQRRVDPVVERCRDVAVADERVVIWRGNHVLAGLPGSQAWQTIEVTGAQNQCGGILRANFADEASVVKLLCQNAGEVRVDVSLWGE